MITVWPDWSVAPTVEQVLQFSDQLLDECDPTRYDEAVFNAVCDEMKRRVLGQLSPEMERQLAEEAFMDFHSDGPPPGVSDEDFFKYMDRWVDAAVKKT